MKFCVQFVKTWGWEYAREAARSHGFNAKKDNMDKKCNGLFCAKPTRHVLAYIYVQNGMFQ